MSEDSRSPIGREAALLAENARLRRLLEAAGLDPRESAMADAAHARLREDRLQAVLDSATDYAIMTADAEGVLTGWNVGAQHVFGWRQDETLGRRTDMIFTPEDRASGVPVSEMTTALATGRAPDERWHLRKDGSRFWAQGALTLLPNGQGFLKVLRDRTASRRIEERLRESEEFNRRVLGASADCIKVIDLDARLEFMSEGGMCVMEVDDFAAIEGAWWPSFWEGEGHVRALTAVAHAKKGITGRFQGFATTMKGSPRWWDVLVTPINGADGRPEKLLSVSRDVTEQKRADDQMRTNEARLRFLEALDVALRASRDAQGAMSAATALLGRHLEVSRCAYADVDADNDGFVIRADHTAPGVASSVGAYSLDLFGARTSQKMRGGLTLVVRHVAAELAAGEGREMFQAIGIGAIVCCPLVKGGRLAAMMAVHQEAPRDWRADEIALIEAVVERCWAHVERVGAEERLRESEERLRLATENAEVAFWDVDHVHDALIWPPRLKAMFGISPDVPVSLKDFYDGLHPDDRESTSAAYAAAGDPARRALYDVEYRTIGKEDGVVRWVAAKGRGVFDAAGRCLRVIGTAIDITARKAAEERLHELNETLERRVEAEVADRLRAEEALRQTQKTESLGQLTGGVAHDFNNLLAAILSNLDLVRKRTSDVGLLRLLDGAIKGAERGAALTSRLLAFARRQDLKTEAVDVAALLEGMKDLLARSLGPSVRLDLDVPAGLPSVLADPNQLELAILNLAVNARDAMPNGGRLAIAARDATASAAGAPVGLAGGGYVRIDVEDEGEGMDARTLSRAAEPFFTTKGVGKGTGLGLSMAQGMAEQLGGALAIESAPDKGATISLWLPQAAPDAVAAGGGAPRSTASHTTRTLKVLVVDDDALVCMGTAAMLEDLGHETVEAGSGKAALDLLRQDPAIDLVVTDQSMPGMTGLELAAAIQAMRPELPIVLATGYANLPSGEAFHLPKLSKPFRQDELAEVVGRVFGDRRASSEANA